MQLVATVERGELVVLLEQLGETVFGDFRVVLVESEADLALSLAFTGH